MSESGEAFAYWRYDAFGQPLPGKTRAVTDIDASSAAAVASALALRYAGYVYDAESELYCAGRRFYDPKTCQFLTADPLRSDGEESLYQYCAGDPVGNTDPSGLVLDADGTGRVTAVNTIATNYSTAKSAAQRAAWLKKLAQAVKAAAAKAAAAKAAAQSTGASAGSPLNTTERVAYGVGGVLLITNGKLIASIGAGLAAKGGTTILRSVGLLPETAGVSGAGVGGGSLIVVAGGTVWVAGTTVDDFGEDMLDMALEGRTRETNVHRIRRAIQNRDAWGVAR